MREIVHIQAGQCGNQIGAKVSFSKLIFFFCSIFCSLKFLRLFSSASENNEKKNTLQATCKFMLNIEEKSVCFTQNDNISLHSKNLFFFQFSFHFICIK